jgi:hypothetical protein
MAKRTHREYDGGVLKSETVEELDDLARELSITEALDETDADAALTVVKSNDEHRYTLGIAYAANKVDAGVAKDGHRDFVGADALEQCAWNFMMKSREIGIFHSADEAAVGRGDVVESYIWRGDDWEIGDTVVKAGDWLLGIQWDEPTWALVKSGAITGLSPQGRAARRTPDDETLAQVRT